MGSLVAAEVRFLVVGGVAVNAYGYRRFTADLDLVVELGRENLLAALNTLSDLGYRPSVPVTADQLADAEFRARLHEEKGMEVLQLWSDAHRETPVDIFATEPFPFDEEYSRATIKHLGGAGPVRIVALPTLIAMKRAAGREEDRIDIRYLESLLEER